MSTYTTMTLEELKEIAKIKNANGLYPKCAIKAQEELCKRAGKLQYSYGFVESNCDYACLCKQETNTNWEDNYDD